MKKQHESNGRDRQMAMRSEKWTEILKEFHGSGQTRKAFAEHQGIALATLSYWLTREKRKQLKSVPPIVFGELKLGGQGLPNGADWAMEVVSPTGFTVRSRQPLAAGLLIRVLRAG